MDGFFSNLPSNLPPWTWITLTIIICLTIYFVAKNASGNKKQSNSISNTTIKRSKIKQQNIDKNEES